MGRKEENDNKTKEEYHLAETANTKHIAYRTEQSVQYASITELNTQQQRTHTHRDARACQTDTNTHTHTGKQSKHTVSQSVFMVNSFIVWF